MSAAPNIAECGDCGYDELNCRCDDADFMDDLDCTHCNGEGTEWGDEKGGDFGWYDPNKLYPCFACNGSGKRRDQWFF